MTDQADAGSVVVDPPAGAPATPAVTTDNGSAVTTDQSPFSGLSEGARKWVDTKGYKSHEDIVSAALSLEQKLGTSVAVPAADAPKEEWEKFNSKLPEAMRPVTSPDKLEFKRPEGLPENVPYSDELATAAKQWAVDAGATPKVAQAYHDKYVAYAAEQAKAAQTALAQSVEATHTELVKDWGPVDSDGFKQKLEVSNRALKKLGLVDAYKAKGILLADGTLTDPQIARAFLAVGDAMFKEDTIDGGNAAVGENPFKRDSAGKIKSMTAISALVKSDPERAKRLAREAGENPDLWVSSNPL
ncbi:hypothetical protein [Mesorhizobium sp. B2-3-4]|uniref:hypothetical protein n=1 Tax=Mesorhizobium sp. B2-3-4 TaxID=2589959 RepID=UPI00112670D7|nr:hypothetical protein [Mesorhizobium sp. B2-3-4]TPM25709.1 hypothetical protein FJ967_32305 [Mesorhizobium sp. B2-3-4]